MKMIHRFACAALVFLASGVCVAAPVVEKETIDLIDATHSSVSVANPKNVLISVYFVDDKGDRHFIDSVMVELERVQNMSSERTFAFKNIENTPSKDIAKTKTRANQLSVIKYPPIGLTVDALKISENTYNFGVTYTQFSGFNPPYNGSIDPKVVNSVSFTEQVVLTENTRELKTLEVTSNKNKQTFVFDATVF